MQRRAAAKEGHNGDWRDEGPAMATKQRHRRKAPREAYRQIQNLPCDSKCKSDAVFAYYATCIHKQVFHELPSQLQYNPIIVAVFERKVYSNQLQGTAVRALFTGTS